ncbi:hypothetical protein GNI_116830 [Gregarina niphandrodes]|uniref:Uncharacterized protein n=1 Tax=Gregarina niphandrodes TaxID=110365 RepID=A0A023B2Q9_GRENI|nr:hypothetical protein GNI_116830 [Gregarina niphandrodes]EZG55155.1 hypothetical protein GNI_116830 [Gregarina niphandrodes]|eukprot:XP_011131743.1 hypothetical protein GNI_116830 [Gregarina niphandrodes]
MPSAFDTGIDFAKASLEVQLLNLAKPYVIKGNEIETAYEKLLDKIEVAMSKDPIDPNNLDLVDQESLEIREAIKHHDDRASQRSINEAYNSFTQEAFRQYTKLQSRSSS